MKLWTKICLKCIAFALIFLVILSGVQNVLRYKGEYAEDMLDRYNSIREQADAGMSTDVLYLGSSPVYAAVAPMVMWEDYGYTGLNLGTSMQNAMSLYYSLLDILDIAQPKVIVLDMCDLTQARLADDMDYYYSYRKAIDTIHSPVIRWQLLRDIVKTTGTLEHIFPIVRFHERWSSLEEADLGHREKYYHGCTKGALMNDAWMPLSLEGSYDEMVTPNAYSELSLAYYENIISLCAERGIQVIAFTPPTAKIGVFMADYAAVKRYCNEKGIVYLNYNDPAIQAQMGLDWDTDFYDREHLNISGCFKLSKLLASQLDTLCDLPDHRDDPAYASWAEDLAAFRSLYAEPLQNNAA